MTIERQLQDLKATLGNHLRCLQILEKEAAMYAVVPPDKQIPIDNKRRSIRKLQADIQRLEERVRGLPTNDKVKENTLTSSSRDQGDHINVRGKVRAEDGAKVRVGKYIGSAPQGSERSANITVGEISASGADSEVIIGVRIDKTGCD